MPAFSEEFRTDLATLLRWRRDVRSFLRAPVDEALVGRCLESFHAAPSVGLSQPWRLVRVQSAAARAAAQANFRAANAEALAGYEGEQAAGYARLKLSGMAEAPVQIAVFCDEETGQGQGLGTRTMPEMLRYSVVAAVTQFWLVARAHGLGLGWVSILDPDRLRRDLDLPEAWSLVAYLCLGWPSEETDRPALETAGWEARAEALSLMER